MVDLEPSPTPAVAPAVPFPRQALLLVGSAREVLARILPGDPLAVRARVTRRLAERSVFLDADRVHLRALARVARRALRWRGSPELSTWLGARVDEAIDDLLAEGGARAARERTGADALAELGRPLGLEPDALERALAALNTRPEEERRALRELLAGPVDASSARESADQAADVLARARRAFRAALDATLVPVPGRSQRTRRTQR